MSTHFQLYLSEYLQHSRVVGIALALPTTPPCKHVSAYFDPPRMFSLGAIRCYCSGLSPPNKISMHACATEGGEREESAGEYEEYGKRGEANHCRTWHKSNARYRSQHPKTRNIITGAKLPRSQNPSGPQPKIQEPRYERVITHSRSKFPGLSARIVR